MRFAVVGGDRRSVLLSIRLARDGHKVYTYALERAGLPPDVPKSGCLQGCIYGADCVILPVPAEKGGFIHAPFAAEPLETGWFADALWPGQLLCGGKLSDPLRSASLAAGAVPEDILERESFAHGNAALTAEGAVGLIISESEKSIYRGKALILGFGRLGKLLALRLAALGAEVSIAARSAAARAEAGVFGLEALDFRELDGRLGAYDFIVNTVPWRVLTEKLLCGASDALLIELASAPGGFDRVLAENLGLRVIAAPGLPGTSAPVAAAELIRESIFEILNEQED